MAFDAGNLSIIVQPISGGGLRFISYRTDDSVSTVTGTDYFEDGEMWGLRESDLIFVTPISGAVDPYVLVVTGIDADGNATATFSEEEMRKSIYDPAGKAGQVVTVADILDEDDMASNSATAVPSQQSLVSYTIPRFDVAADLEAVTPASRIDTVLVAGQAYERITASYWGLGPNVFTLGDMSTATGLTLTGAWAISGGVAVQTVTGAGTVRQNNVLTIGTTYFTSFDMVTRSAGSAYLFCGGGTQGTARTTVGTHTEFLTCAGDAHARVASNSLFVGSVDNVTMQALPSTAIRDASGAWWGPVEGLAAFAQEAGDRRIWDLKERGQEVLMVADYWKVGEADFGPALNRIAALSDERMCIVLPRAAMPLNTQANFTDRNVTFAGRGHEGSQIVIGNAAGRINFLCTDTTDVPNSVHQIGFDNVEIVVDVVSASGAGPVPVVATWSATGSVRSKRGRFADFTIRPSQSGRWFNKGIRIVDGSNFDFSNVKIENRDGFSTSGAEAAIEIERVGATNMTGYAFANCHIGRVNKGLSFKQAGASGSGTFEGITWVGGEIVFTAYGLHDDVTSGTGRYIDSVSFSAMHMNCSRAAVKAGRARGHTINGSFLFFQGAGDTAPSPFEAAFNILLQCDGFKVAGGSSITRTNDTGIIAAGPAFLLPDAAAVNWVRTGDHNLYANFSELIAVQSGGALTTARDKVFIGRSTYSNTPITAGSGYRGDAVSLGGNLIVTDGDTVSFGHTFQGLPGVAPVYRGTSGGGVDVWVRSVSTTGFVVGHNGVVAQAISWTASGI